MQCKTCKLHKNEDNFAKNEIKRKSLACKECCKKRKRKYYLENKEKVAAATKQYYLNNHEKEKEYRRNYKQKNKKSLRIKARKYENNKRKNNINYKLRLLIKTSISNYIKKSGNSLIKYLPYSINELKSHIESLFEPWMSWNNQGNYRLNEWDDNDQSTWKWHLDHIIPHSTFKYESMEDEEFKKCWSLENLRPYSAKQNIIDGSNRIRHKIF